MLSTEFLAAILQLLTGCKNAARHFEGLHNIFKVEAGCNFSLAGERLVKCCKLAAHQLYSYFKALLWHCTVLFVSYSVIIMKITQHFLVFLKRHVLKVTTAVSLGL